MPPPRILRIFGRYQHYGGEEAIAKRIHRELAEVMDADWFESSTESLLGDSIAARLAAPWKVVHNGAISKQIRQLQEKHQYSAWEIHNVFPALSPVVYQAAFDMGVPVIHFLHNYRLSCVNGMFLNHGETCHRCIKGNFLPAVQTTCWRDSKLACGFVGLALTRVRRMRVFDRISAWVALSQAQKILHLKIGLPEKTLHVVPHFLQPSRSDVPEPPQEGYALFLGRLSPEKGVANLLDAWPKVKSEGARLVIAGTGPEEERLRRRITKNKLSSVELRGFVEPDQHETLWANAKFLIVPSIWDEPFPLVVLEAFAHARPLIVSNYGSLPETVADSGFAVNPHNAEELANACDRLFRDTELARNMGNRGIMRLRRVYNRDVWLDKIRTVYASCGVHLP
jgi:glycosyltransferase involved in cell wall biosynthesis